jgi:hypothetical protein
VALSSLVERGLIMPFPQLQLARRLWMNKESVTSLSSFSIVEKIFVTMIF